MQKKENIETKKKLKVAFYLRISTEDQKEMYGISLQLESLKNLLKSREYDLEFAWDRYIYKDENISWSLKIEDRPAMKRLFADLSFWKPFDLVLVYKIDRFARSLRVLLDITEELKRKHVGFISSLESIDTSTHFWQAMLWILWVFSELEKNMNQQKMESWKIQSVKSWNKLAPVYWYDRYNENRVNYYKINAEEANIITQIFKDYTSPTHKWDLWYIREKLINNKVFTPWVSREKKSRTSIASKTKNPYGWTNYTIKRILENSVYIWEYYYWKTTSIIDEKTWKRKKIDVEKEKWISSDVPHTKIISEKIFNEAQKILQDKKKTAHEWKHVTKWNVYIFTWLIKCDACKWNKTNWWMYHWIWETSNKITQYKCKWTHKNIKICDVIPIQANDLDKILLWEVKKIINNPPAIEKYTADNELIWNEKKAIQNEIEKHHKNKLNYQQWKKNLYEALIMNKVDTSTYKKDDDELDNLISRENQRIEELNLKLNNQFELDEYIQIFSVMKEFIWDKFDEIFEDKEKTQKFMKFLIDEIIIYSKQNDWTYSISGPKKERQLIPYRIEVRLKLPQVFIDEIKSMGILQFVTSAFKSFENDDDEKNNNKKWGKWGWTSSKSKTIYNKTKKTIEWTKNKLRNNIIRVKNSLSPL